MRGSLAAGVSPTLARELAIIMTGLYNGIMETIPITEAKARIAELAERVAREHDHFTITRNGRADVMLISVAEYESMQETLDILGDQEAVADLRQSREDFAAGDTYTAAQVRAELEQRRRLGAP